MSAFATETSTAPRTDCQTEMPAGLTPEERRAYVKGYANGAHRYTKKHGTPSIVSKPGETVDVAELHRITREHEAERHPTAHKAGMAELRRHWKRYGLEERRAAMESPKRLAAVKPARKPRKTAKPAEVPAVVSAAVESGRLQLVRVGAPETSAEPVAETATSAPMTYAARKASRRELARTMREQGIDPRGEAWEAAKAAAGLA